MSTLTRAEAQERAAALAVASYQVELDLTAGPDRFRSTTTAAFTSRSGGTFVDVAADELIGATLDGEPLPLDTWVGRRLALPYLTAGEHVLVVDAWMAYSHDGEGLHRFVDPVDGGVQLCATSALHAAPRWFACFDQPDLKASVSLLVHCPPGWTVLGNGPATVEAPGVVRTAPSPPIPTYVATIVAGDYHSVRADHDGIPLGLHVRSSLAGELDRDAPELLALTAAALDEFQQLFGIRYPFGEYHQAFVPEFNWGAMENPGCVTFRDQMIFRSAPSESEVVNRATTIVHEMAHMWFGDLVTMAWWDDLWLNESFAEYLASRVTSRITDLPVREQEAVGRRAWGYDTDRRSSTHPVAGNGVDDADAALADFDGISYAKGAAVLGALAEYLGDEMFIGGLRTHVKDHAYGNATFGDLLAAWAAHTGPGTPDADDLTAWAEQWLRRAGIDTIAVVPGAEGPAVRRGDPEHGPAATRPHALVIAGLDDDGGVLATRRTVVAADDEPAGVPGLVVPDATAVDWAVVRLAEHDWARVPGVLAGCRDPQLRATLWVALRMGVADGVVGLGVVLGALEQGLAGESDVTLSRVLPWAGEAIDLFVPPGAARDTARARLAGVAAALLETASAAGSGALTPARALAAATDDRGLLRSWGRGDLPAGLALDEDLRWRLLQRRAELDDVGPDELAAALALDPTSTAADRERRARASRPDARAKAEAWELVVSDGAAVPLYGRAAAARGIFLADQEAVWAPYVERWFDELPATARFRSGQALAVLAESSFPALSVEASTVAAARELAARDDVVPALRRVASDRADDLARAVAVRARG